MVKYNNREEARQAIIHRGFNPLADSGDLSGCLYQDVSNGRIIAEPCEAPCWYSENLICPKNPSIKDARN